MGPRQRGEIGASPHRNAAHLGDLLGDEIVCIVVDGVAQVVIYGEQHPAIRIQVDPAKLASSGLTLEEVRRTLVGATTIAAKGTVNTARTSFTIAANDQIIDPEPFDESILAYRNGGPIRVRDVGQAVSEAADRNVASYQNNKPRIILAVF